MFKYLVAAAFILLSTSAQAEWHNFSLTDFIGGEYANGVETCVTEIDGIMTACEPGDTSMAGGRNFSPPEPPSPEPPSHDNCGYEK